MKTILFALALFMVGCVTEPEPVTQDHGFDCLYVQEADSTITPICTLEKK